MHTCTSLLRSEGAPETVLSPIQGAIRGLVSLLEGTEHSGVESYTTSHVAEQVLVDVEVDGVRYLVIRMAVDSPSN
jgi:hypothetical protein